MDKAVSASLRRVQCSPQKLRLVANMVRGLSVDQAMNLLNFDGRKATFHIRKVLNSAIANAEHNCGADVDKLAVQSIQVNAGSITKRIRARARGRSDRLLKRSSHITVAVMERTE